MSSHAENLRKDLRVTVFVPTFNQAPYIATALESALSQETWFPFKILVQDDASTDGTREIVQDLAQRYPKHIELKLHSENQYSKGRRVIALGWPHFRGDYVAFLDGDDEWTDSTKLARQVEFMDAHPGCALCQTMTSYWDETRQQELNEFPIERFRCHAPGAYLAEQNFVQTSATVLRLAALPTLPDDFDDISLGDYGVFALAACNGWIGYIPEKMVLYRVHDANLWTNLSDEVRIGRTNDLRRYLLRHLPPAILPYWISVLNESEIALPQKMKRSLMKTILNIKK